MFFAVGAALAGALMYGVYVLPDAWRPGALWERARDAVVASVEPDPVLVLVVGSDANVQALRDAVEPDEIVVDVGSAFALHAGRIVAARFEDASRPLSDAGWVDRPLQLVSRPGRSDAATRGGPAPAADSPGPGGGASLSPGEALRLLHQLH